MKKHIASLKPGISIHALVKGATEWLKGLAGTDFISIHALVKRATIVSRTILRVRFISIHALVKRATFDGFAD